MEKKFEEEYQVLEENKELSEKIREYLISEKVDPRLKGFNYFVDLVTILLFKKKYSMSFMKSTYPFTAHKYNIKVHSVQRQLRYTFTIANDRGLKPEEVYKKIWYMFKNDELVVEKRKEER